MPTIAQFPAPLGELPGRCWIGGRVRPGRRAVPRAPGGVARSALGGSSC